MAVLALARKDHDPAVIFGAERPEPGRMVINIARRVSGNKRNQARVIKI
jgi:hypothetical protein